MTDKKERINACILSREELIPGIVSLWLEAPDVVSAARPGQFVSLYCADASRLLPRPISICELDPQRGALRLVFRVAGKGTAEFSRYQEGEHVSLLGPLGNGYPVEIVQDGMTSLLFGGGIGIPPLLELAKQLPGRKVVVAGYRDQLFLTEELSRYAEVIIATEDGSFGTRGTVLDAASEAALTGDIIFSCGPTPMLRALKAWAGARQRPCYLSLEERMACGVGACLGCVCKTSSPDAHSKVNNARICADGPVFSADDVVL